MPTVQYKPRAKGEPSLTTNGLHYTSLGVPEDLDRWIREYAAKTGRTYRGVLKVALEYYRDNR